MYNDINEQIYDLISSIIRVNYAGEFGAKQIYKAQIKTRKSSKQKEILMRMLSEELEHLNYFTKFGQKLQIRPTVFHPIWRMGAYILGYLTGKIGFEASMACTVGVEEVIQKHYNDQINQIDLLLNQIDERNQYHKMLVELRNKISQFVNDEKRHEDIGHSFPEKKYISKPIRKISNLISKVAISLTKKF